MKKLDLRDVKSLLVIVTGFCILSFVFRYRGNITTADVLFYLAIFVGVISLLIPAAGYYIVWMWYKIAEILGWVNSRIILSALFYLFLFPISVIYRLFNKDSLNIKKNKSTTTMFINRNHDYSASDLENTW